MVKKRIMVVEDEGITALRIQNSLKKFGYTVTSTLFSGEKAVKKVEEDRPDLVLMDIVLMGKMDGIEAAKRIRSRYKLPVVYLTAYSDDKMMKRIKKTEPFGYIVKPFEDKELHMAIEIALYKSEMEARLKQSEERYREVVEGTGDLVTRVDGKGNIVYVNHVAEKILGVKTSKCIGMSAFQFVHPDDRQANIQWFNDCVQRRLEQVSTENRMVNRKTGDVHHMLWTSNFYYDEKGKVIRINGIARDITARIKFEEHLKTTAITDDLTGLLNRRGFFTLAEQQCKLADRTKRNMALLYIDIDGFKTINDELGHSKGDRALIDTANILKSAFRESDIIARIGGDEFAVLLTEPSESDIESIVVKHLRNRLEEFNLQAVREYELIFSIGMAGYDQKLSCSVDELLMKADDRMYKDKKHHKLIQNKKTVINKNRGET